MPKPSRLLPALALLVLGCVATPQDGSGARSLVLPDGSVYEGPLRDGRPHGRGQLRWPSGAMYEGAFRGGRPDGQGRRVEASGAVYVGPFVDGLGHGEGRLTYASGTRYEGDFRYGEPHGEGTYTGTSGLVYEGSVRHGEFHGSGRLAYADGTVYEGEIRHGIFEGEGTLRTVDGSEYRGDFHADEFHGHGTLKRADGTSYTGRFREGEFHGPGRFETANGAVFEGEFREGTFSGRGSYRAPSGSVYAGDFVDWDFNGRGTAVTAGGNVYVGSFENDRYHGQGHFVRADGRVYAGAFRDGRFHGEGTLTWTEDGEKHVAHGVWEEGRYVRGDTDALLSPEPVDAEALLFAQPGRLDDALARVAPSRPGVPDLYFLGFGAWEAQEVFAQEVLFARRLFEEQLGARRRTLTLLNHRPTLDREPLATATNLEHALRGLADRMDLDEDILFLFLTSHGSPEAGVAISFEGLPLADLAPERLDAMLDSVGIRWRVVVVSACYAGAFVEPMRDPHTLVVTAAAEDRRSFGCSDDAEFTYFGGAFLRDALPEAPSFEEAFRRARAEIAARETEEGIEEASQPQIAVGEAIGARLAEWRALLPREPFPAAPDEAR